MRIGRLSILAKHILNQGSILRIVLTVSSKYSQHRLRSLGSATARTAEQY